MKNLITKILKEETESMDNINKGINIAVKMIKKYYPYIIGWEFDGGFNEYNYTFYINLILDREKVMKYYGLESKYYFNEDEKYALPLSTLLYGGKVNPFDIHSEINSLIGDIYKDLPSHIQIKNSNGDVKDIKVDGYFFM
jgi:hypothetical protein